MIRESSNPSGPPTYGRGASGKMVDRPCFVRVLVPADYRTGSGVELPALIGI